MKTIKTGLILTAFGILFYACNNNEASEECIKVIDSLTEQISEYKKYDKRKSELVAQFNNKLTEYGNIQDSIKKRELVIQNLKRKIRKKGYANRNESKKLNQMLAEIDNFLIENQEFANELNYAGYKKAGQKEIVKILLTNIKDKQNQINNLKEEIIFLQKKVKGLEIKNENLSDKTKELEKEKKKIIENAKQLTLYGFDIALPKNIWKNTKKAKKIDKINLCFTLNKSKFVASANKNAYIRIITPDGYVLEKSEEKLFNFKGEKIGYTLKKNIQYNKNKKETFCTDWQKSDEKLKPGRYSVTLFIDGSILEEQFFTLEK